MAGALYKISSILRSLCSEDKAWQRATLEADDRVGTGGVLQIANGTTHTPKGVTIHAQEPVTIGQSQPGKREGHADPKIGAGSEHRTVRN